MALVHAPGGREASLTAWADCIASGQMIFEKPGWIDSRLQTNTRGPNTTLKMITTSLIEAGIPRGTRLLQTMPGSSTVISTWYEAAQQHAVC